MAEKEVKIKVTTEAEMSQLEDLKSAIEEAKSLTQELGSTGSESLNEIGGEADDAASSVEELDSSADDLNSTIDNISPDSLNEVSTEADNAATSTDEAASSADELNNSLGNIDGSGLNGAATETDGLTNGLSDAAQSADELGNSLGIIESASLMGLAEGIGQYADSAENLAQQMNTASISVGQLATQTGIAEPQMVSLINHISNATFPNEEAMMYVKSLDQIGVSSENLGKSATDLDKINDAFGMGATKVNSLGQELSVLGVDMNNVSSAFNALAYANANTVGGMDNYYNFIRKYDAQFKELGYNVDQASIIIAGATQKYGGGRAALSGLSEALKEANGDSRKLEEALGLQAGALDNASAITGQYEGQLQQLANEEAEHKTWLDQLNAAWEDISLSLSPVLSPLASFVGLIGQVGQFALAINSINTLVKSIREMELISTISTKFQAFKSTLMTVISSAKQAVIWLGTSLKNALIGAGNAAKGAITSIANMGKAILTAGYNALKAAAMWLYEKAQIIASTIAKHAATIASYALAAAEWLAASPILLVVVAIVALIAALWYLYNTNESVRNAIDGFIATLRSVGEAIYGSLMGALEWLQGAWQNTVDFLTSGGQAIQDTLGGAFQWLSDAWNGIVNAFNTYAPLIAQVLFIMATGGVGAIVLLIGQFMGMPTQIGGVLQSIVTRIVSWVTNIVSQFTNGATRAVNGFLSPLRGLVASVSAELAAVKAAVMSYIQPIIDAFNALGSAASWAFSVLGLGQNSPGDIYKAAKQEIDWTTEMVKKDTGLAKATGTLGERMVDSFNPSLKDQVNIDNIGVLSNNGLADLLNKLSASLNSNNNSEPTLIFNLYGDIDDDKRMEKFLNAVRKELAWNNKTAGRTV